MPRAKRRWQIHGQNIRMHGARPVAPLVPAVSLQPTLLTHDRLDLCLLRVRLLVFAMSLLVTIEGRGAQPGDQVCCWLHTAKPGCLGCPNVASLPTWFAINRLMVRAYHLPSNVVALLPRCQPHLLHDRDAIIEGMDDLTDAAPLLRMPTFTCSMMTTPGPAPCTLVAQGIWWWWSRLLCLWCWLSFLYASWSIGNHCLWLRR